MTAMKNEHPVAALAKALEVSPSGFHAHPRKAQGQRQQQDNESSRAIGPIFGASRQTYGSPRVTAALRQGGRRCGKNRVARLMRENHLRPKQKRKRWRPQTTDSNHRQPVAENWLAKVPAPDQPDQVWVADITYIDTGEGVQYASGAMAALLAESGAAASMSRRGNCYDNAMMESFWATLKAECFHGERSATRQAAKLQIFDDIEGFYNRTRLHSSLGYQSPLAFEANLKYSRN